MPTLAYVAKLNNWTQQEWDLLTKPNANLQYIIIGQEVSEQGTPYLQIYFQLAMQVKLTTLKKWPGYERMHFETTGRTDEEAATHCKKDGNFVEIGERKKMGRKVARNDLETVREAIDNGDSYDTICETHFAVAARYYKFIKKAVQAKAMETHLTELRKDFEGFLPMPWQQELLNILNGEVDPLKIIWYWEKKGHTGKSYLTNYLLVTKNACVLSGGKQADMACFFAQEPKNIVIFDVMRSEKGSTGFYRLAEDLKDGHVVLTKHRSKTVFFDIPHVVVFANWPPNIARWSADRVQIVEIV